MHAYNTQTTNHSNVRIGQCAIGPQFEPPILPTFYLGALLLQVATVDHIYGWMDGWMDGWMESIDDDDIHTHIITIDKQGHGFTILTCQ